MKRLGALPYQLPRLPFDGLASPQTARVPCTMPAVLAGALGTAGDAAEGTLAAHFALNAALKHVGAEAAWSDVVEGYAAQRLEPPLLKVLAHCGTLPITNFEGLLLALESSSQRRLVSGDTAPELLVVLSPVEELLEAVPAWQLPYLARALRAATLAGQQLVLCSTSPQAAATAMAGLDYQFGHLCAWPVS